MKVTRDVNGLGLGLGKESVSNPFASTIIILGLRVGLTVHSHLPAPTRIDLLIKCVQNPTEICIGLSEQYEHPHNSTQAIF